MAPLHDALRRELEKTVIKARDVAEAGARAALARLTVGEREPGAHLGADDRVLRNRLRARARQLGDRRNERTGEQATERLAQEVAYEAWHRMLFARFLAENRLLIHPEMQVPVSLEECEELAAEEGVGDGWVLASRYAARMLPEIFRPDDPVLQVPLAPEHQQELEQLVGARTLPRDAFLADDALGWVYQFWQARRKDEVNASGEKITGETLPAVTQLFTEPYMVSFLLENTIGAWWAGRNPNENLPAAMPYLRRSEDGSPAAGAFEGWPRTWRDFTLLDPCCGSGHFLVAALKLIVPLRMREEGISARDAVDAALRENLHGLELDARCTQIAAFALALTAWTYPGAGGYRPLPPIQIACSGLAVGARREDWVALAEGDTRLGAALGRLYDLFKAAPELGSLIDPGAEAEDLVTASFADVRPLFTRALTAERIQRDAQLEATSVAAQGIAKAAELLARRYTLVLTNVPYLGRSKQGDVLRDYTRRHYRVSDQDLATVFLERCVALCEPASTTAIVLPQNWLFLTGYTALREKLLQTLQWNFVARLGETAFSSSQAAGAFVALVCMSRRAPATGSTFFGVDASEVRSVEGKQESLLSNGWRRLHQARQLTHPDARVLLDDMPDLPLLDAYASNHQGLSTGDNPRFRRMHWEVPRFGRRWVPEQSTVTEAMPYGGMEGILMWDEGDGELRAFGREMVRQLHNVDRRGQEAWGHRGVAISQMRALPATLYTGTKFDTSVAVLLPRRPEYLPALWAFCSSPAFAAELRKINAKVSVDNGYFGKVPFDLQHWTSVADALYPAGLPEPSSNDPTQWLFDGVVATSTEPLQVAVCRLLGYRWPEESSSDPQHTQADLDGIVCLPPVRGERPAAERLHEVLSAAFGKNWSPAKRDELLASVGYAGNSIEEWLRDGFFEQHCRLFHQRPFIWHVWDGRKDGFSALVNYHKLDRSTLESLTFTYLGDWIARQEEAARVGEPGAEARLVAARDLQDELKRVLAGEPPYDIFVRWKPLHEQPVGWAPDLDDGVRVNIRPFVTAGVLRRLPNIKWGKDRGKNPPSAPWGEERWNQYEDIPAEQRPEYLRDVDHLTTEIKRRAREAHARGLPLSRLHEVGA